MTSVVVATWEGRPVELVTTRVEFDVLVDGVNAGVIHGPAPVWSWRHTSARSGWAESQADAVTALLEAHSEAVREWADTDQLES